MNDDQASDMLQQNEEQSRQPEVTKSSTSTPRTEEMEMKQQLSSPRSAALNQQLEQRYAKSLAQSNGATLDLSALGLKELPSLDELGRRFPKLRQLNVRRNALRYLPDGLSRAFPQLVTLNAAENVLEVLSAASIGGLRSLERLNLAQNQLRELPASTFEHLDALEEIDVRANLIETLSFDKGGAKLNAQGGLHKLQVLLLSDNRLRSIDSTVADKFPKLRVVDLKGNPELEDAPEKLRRLHERNVLLHSRAKRRELITRALSIRKAVAQALATPAIPDTRVK